MFPTLTDWILNWISNQPAIFLGTTSNQQLRITIMTLKYLECFGTCGHWLLTGVCTPAGKSVRAVDDWKDDDRVGFMLCPCCAVTSEWPLPSTVSPRYFPAMNAVDLFHLTSSYLCQYDTPGSPTESDALIRSLLPFNNGLLRWPEKCLGKHFCSSSLYTPTPASSLLPQPDRIWLRGHRSCCGAMSSE